MPTTHSIRPGQHCLGLSARVIAGKTYTAGAVVAVRGVDGVPL